MEVKPAQSAQHLPGRRRLPAERQAKTRKFDVAGHEGYVTIGYFPEGAPGEIFVHMSKQGSTVSGLMDALATSWSMLLQYGVPLSTIIDKFEHMRFEPNGVSDLGEVSSVLDYLAKLLRAELPTEE